MIYGGFFMQAAIIHFENIFRKKDQFFIGKTLKKIKKSIKIENNEIPVYILF